MDNAIEDISVDCKQVLKFVAVECLDQQAGQLSISFVDQNSEATLSEKVLAQSSDKPYQCDECSIQFRYLSGFKRHSKLHADTTMQHSCRKCFQRFANVNDLVNHEQTHIVEKPFPCGQCSRRYKTAKSLKSHQISHHSERPYKCDQCFVTFHKLNELNEHLRIHLVTRKLACSKCSDDFDDADLLKQHLEDAHADSNDHECYLCLKNCESQHELNEHLMSHGIENHPVGESLDEMESAIVTHFLQCESEPLVADCKIEPSEGGSKEEDGVHLRFVSMGTASDNHEEYSIVESLAMLCETPSNHIDWNPSIIAVESVQGLEEDLADLISKPSVNVEQLSIKVEQRSREDEKQAVLGPGGFELAGELDAKKLCEEELFLTQNGGKGVRFECQRCLSTFTRKSSLKRHVMQHTGERPYQCKICARTFGQSGTLRTHMLRHMDEKLYKCDRCFKEFATPGDLNRHLRYHTGERPFGCPQCERMFAERGHLRSHMRTHTGERPFSCEECDRTFLDVSSRNRHVQVEHATVKMFQCQTCNKACGSSYELKGHERKHTDERLHFCSECGKQFSCLNSVRLHMRRHTGEKPFQCPYCEKKFAHSCNYKRHVSQEVCQA